MNRIDFELERPKKIPTRGCRTGSDSFLHPIELVGVGIYSALMLDELFKQDVYVSSYTVKDLPNSIAINKHISLDVRTFTTPRGLTRVIGNENPTVIFNLGMQIQDSVIKRLGENLWNIHPSRLPEFEGVADPVDEMVKSGKYFGYITIHRVTGEIDRGQVLGCRSFKFKPDPQKREYSSELVSEIYRDSVIPAAARLLKEILQEEMS